jgi:hypothetical protein
MANALLFALLAADLTGFWTGVIQRENAEPVDVAFQFTHQGPALTGKLYDDFRSPAVLEGKVDGGTISFLVILPEQAGNEFNQTRYRFTGKVVDDGVIELTRERESSTRAGSKGSAENRRNAKLTFRVKRL